MDNPTRWNITNSAQNIVSALIDPSKQFDHAFKHEWSNTFSRYSKASLRSEQDPDLETKLFDYVSKLETRKHVKKQEAQQEALLQEQNINSKERQNKVIVPAVFMKEDFDLSNIDVFRRVISSSSTSSTSTSSALPLKSLLFTKSQLNQLQQTFTDYSDIIEEQLANQISNRSGDFFQVMSSVGSVMDELSLAIKSVSSLRRKCSNLNHSLILPNMKNIRLSKTRNNVKLVLDKLNKIAYLCKVQPMIHLSLAASDFVGALDLITKSRTMLRKELTGITCLKHVENELVGVEHVIGRMIQEEFVTLITTEWSGPLSPPALAAAQALSLLQNQADIFITRFHEERKRRIEAKLETELWKSVESIPADFQDMSRKLIDDNVNMGDLFENSNSSSNLEGNYNLQDSAVILDLRQSNGSKAGYSNNCVKVGGSTYVIVNSVISLIQIVMEYCKCAHDIKTLSAELLERVFKILQLYNSRTYHLVYGAGAIQVAGLKTITTRNLIVTQRSLKLIILLIPSIYKHFSSLLPDHSRLKRFDEVRLSYENHAHEIVELVNSIFKDVIDLQLQEWDAKPPVPSPQFSAVAQHLMRLHDNIQDALPPDELRLLFLTISQTFKDVLMVHLRRLNINSDAGPQQWLVTQELTFYKISLSKLSVFKGWELNYDDLWSKLSPTVGLESSSLEHQQQQQLQPHQ